MAKAKKRSATTKTRTKTSATRAKARVEGATTKARKKVARVVAPKRKRPRKPKTMIEKVGEVMSQTVGAVMGKGTTLL